MNGLIKRSFTLAGHRTSVALEEEFWAVLLQMAQARGQSLAALVAEADTDRGPDRPLASSLRIIALKHALATTVIASSDSDAAI
ncbi:MAG TPA: aryl-sulfate sulfotransferase [Acetobacteraceae bacterium]|jgi:predicted DNA-binding ribbon-helix-helix protein|nr:aryl-sulfate sulfotransferase [Acetobacteraceae bacterium]